MKKLTLAILVMVMAFPATNPVHAGKPIKPDPGDLEMGVLSPDRSPNGSGKTATAAVMLERRGGQDGPLEVSCKIDGVEYHVSWKNGEKGKKLIPLKFRSDSSVKDAAIASLPASLSISNAVQKFMRSEKQITLLPRGYSDRSVASDKTLLRFFRYLRESANVLCRLHPRNCEAPHRA